MISDNSSLVSVIVPIYNAETFLAQCLDSIAEQSYRNLEIICINDGSTDGSLAILQDYASQDDRFVLIDKQNEGYGTGCNLGLDRARGQWVSIIEPDDWIDTSMYKEMLDFASSFSEQIDIVKTPYRNINNWNDPARQKVTNSLLHKRLPTSKKPFTIAEHPVLIEKHPSIWSAIYRKDFLDENGIRFPTYPGAGWADNPFLIETMVCAKAIIFLHKAFYNYRTDLPFSTVGHSTDDAVARPFDRWLDMTRILLERNVTDPRILQSHNFRGFKYIDGAIYDDGWENPIVQQKTCEVLSMMDESLVMSDPKLNKRFKALYYEAQGKPVPEIPMKGRTSYLLSEAVYSLRAFGPLDTLNRLRNLLLPPAERTSREKLEKKAERARRKNAS